jgi:hypothetical protein
MPSSGSFDEEMSRIRDEAEEEIQEFEAFFPLLSDTAAVYNAWWVG